MNIKNAVIRVVDCETTGLDSNEHRVVEIACVDMNYSKGIISSVSQLVNPQCKIPLGAMAVHHITDEMVSDAPTIDAAWPTLRDGGAKIDAMAAHNAKFDFSFLKTDLPVLCSLRMALHLWPELESHKNQYLRYYLGVKVDPGIAIHRALGDATVTALILQKMLKIVIEEKGIQDLDGLIKWEESPVLLTKCLFGKKHYGQQWCEVPIDYLQWMKANVRMDDIDLVHTVDYYLSKSPTGQ